MKKLLAILGALGLTATGATTVVACNKGDNSKDTLGGLKASDFEKALLGVADGTALNTKVIGIVAGKVTDEAKNKEITNNLKLFGYTFVVTTKDVIFPLEKDKKFTLTIEKASDDKIKTFYKAGESKGISDADLTLVKKIQGYVSGTKFSSEITIKDQGAAAVDVSGATKPTVAEQTITVKDKTDVKAANLSKLNTDAAITGPVATVIKAVAGVDQTVVLGTDYTITNNEAEGDYTNAKAVEFTVTTKGNKISGSFKFTVQVKAINT
ncbi:MULTISPECIES: spiralin lipoprotein [Spiroplasma]|uniref:spiralin lipoprotein n=1 Tax=Spiroplasma TaxID=2132 RepID=UPI0018DB20F6|nr:MULTISPECIES: spiralin lipoprotein [Spiroplasma]MBH8623203.1 hypothetical protein [Spiroplasma sp. hyd1]UNF62238.1 spiralin lipoprotein [Spiroplasma poulsonii]